MVRYIFRMSRTLFETQCKLLVFERPIILFFKRTGTDRVLAKTDDEMSLLLVVGYFSWFS